MITGMARGSLILNRICILVLPIPFAASSIAASTLVIPVCVLRTIGSSAYMVSAMTAVILPTPENGIKKPSMDMDGIVYRKLMTPIAGFADCWYSLIRIPTSPPKTIAINIEIIEISRCSQSSFKKNSFRSKNKAHISLNILFLPS